MGFVDSTSTSNVERYNPEAVKQALDRWPASEPPAGKIQSRLLHKNNTQFNDTTIFILRSSAISYLPIIHHCYLEFDGTEWHPGAPTDPIFEEKRTDITRIAHVRQIIECCEYCSRQYMHSSFERDRKFNLLFNNCQIQFGVIAESLLTMFFVVTFIVAVCVRSFIVMAISAVSLISVIVLSLIHI